MPRVCTICNHPERSAIESAIVADSGYRNIAKQFAVGYSSVSRHADSHISQEIKHSQEAKEEAQSLDVVKQLKDINTITYTILKTALTDKKNGMALFAIDRVIKQLELQAKLLGSIDTPQINIYLSPEWQEIRSTIIHALTAFPDARIAVASALAGMEVHRDRLN